MPLNKAQSLFADAMLDHPRALDNPPPALAGLFVENGVSLPARLKIYRNNIVGSLTDMMIATFPVIEKLVGREFFEVMARSFILENPPQEGCLNLYGAGFDQFIKDYAPARELPYLPDVATLEIAINDSCYAPDDRPATAEMLATIPPEELANVSLKSRANARFISSKFPLAAIRDFCLGDQSGTLDINSGGCSLLIHRPHLEVAINLIEDDEYAMLKALQNHPLGEAIEQTLQKFSSFDLPKFLQKHLALETFSSIQPN